MTSYTKGWREGSGLYVPPQHSVWLCARSWLGNSAGVSCNHAVQLTFQTEIWVVRLQRLQDNYRKFKIEREGLLRALHMMLGMQVC